MHDDKNVDNDHDVLVVVGARVQRVKQLKKEIGLLRRTLAKDVSMNYGHSLTAMY